MQTRCLDDVRVVGLAEGRLTAAELAVTEAHIDRCERCRTLLAELARGQTRPEADAGSRAGDTIGRYVILTQIGAGGMGVVFAAWDPELDRKIALKLVGESAATDERAQSRLVAEAKALASVRHPNVIGIYDVGRVRTRVFIAMEYMDGGTLRLWSAARQRSWVDSVAKFIEAGRGLAAAHAAGLIHRDFKPDNVLFAADGRCVVTDFGLATAPPEGITTRPQALPETTAWGTPGYLAPEVLRHEAVGPAADQFSFCVALWESVFGAPPFVGDTVEARLIAVAENNRREPAPGAAAVPPGLRRVLNRGLDPNPAERFADMNALLEALHRQAAPSRRVGWLVGAAALASIGVAVAIAADRDECDGGRAQWRPMWSDDARQELQQAFAATEAPAVDETWRRFSSGVDRYVEEWTTQHRAACQVAVGGAEQRRAADAAMRCLSRSRERAFGLLRALVTPTAASVSNSAVAVAALPAPQRCRGGDESEMRRVATEGGGAVADGLQQELDSLETIWRLSEPDAVEPRLRALEQRAAAAGADAVLAGVRVQLGKIQMDAADHDAAHTSLLGGGLLAMASGVPHVAAQAWINLLALDGAERERFAWADHWEQLASATLQQLAGKTRWHAMFSAHLGLVRANRGDWRGAGVAWTEAVSLAIETLGESHPDVAAFRVRLGEALALQHDFEGARAQHDLALAQHLALFGEMHRETARTLRAMGHTLVQQRDYAEALVVQRRALTIQRAVLPPGHREIGYTLGNLGITLHLADPAQGKEALARMEEGLAIIAASQDPDHTRASILRHQIARTLLAMGQAGKARALWESLLAEHGDSPKLHALLGRVHLRLGMALRQLDALEDSEAQLREAVAVAERVHGREHPEVLVALVELGQTLVAAGADDLTPLSDAIAHPAGDQAPEYVERAERLLQDSAAP